MTTKTIVMKKKVTKRLMTVTNRVMTSQNKWA